MTKKQLKDWIKKKGGRTKAAVFLGVDPSTIWRWETGKAKINELAIRIIENEKQEPTKWNF